ncbi:MAG: bL28 family ribosomal protein [Dehalococcoidia bacterium]
MATGCTVCGKTTSFGRNIRHKSSGRWQRKAHKTSRTFRANLQKQVVDIGGVRRRRVICTRCLRTQMKQAI